MRIHEIYPDSVQSCRSGLQQSAMEELVAAAVLQGPALFLPSAAGRPNAGGPPLPPVRRSPIRVGPVGAEQTREDPASRLQGAADAHPYKEPMDSQAG